MYIVVFIIKFVKKISCKRQSDFCKIKITKL